jgi:probable blue pigment (indigoidine) exporter
MHYLNIKMMNMKEPRTALLTLLAPISWGTTYVTVTEFLPPGRPLLVAAMRVLPAGVVLLVINLFVARWRPHGHEWLHTAVLSLCNFGLFFPLLIGAVYRLPGGVAAAVGGVQPLLVAGISRLIIGRRPSPGELMFGGLAVVGVALVVVRPGAGLDPVGVVLALGANVSFATGVVLTKRFAPSNRLGSTGWQLALAGVVLVPFAFAVEGAPADITGRNVGGFVYLSLVATAAAFLLWFNGIRRLPTAAPPLLGLGAPITGALLGWVVLGQSLSGVQVLGMAISVAAIGRGAVSGIGHIAPIKRRCLGSLPT